LKTEWEKVNLFEWINKAEEGYVFYCIGPRKQRRIARQREGCSYRYKEEDTERLVWGGRKGNKKYAPYCLYS